MKYRIITYGCQMNKSDSERIAGLLLGLGWLEAKKPEEADLILINTCSVRQSAEDRVFGQARKLAKLKTLRQAQGLSPLIIGITGCLPGRDKLGKIKAKLPEADLWFPIQDLPKLPEMMARLSLRVRPSQRVDEAIPLMIETATPSQSQSGARAMTKENDYFHVKPIYQNKFQAFVPIQTGCNQYCAYCVVPYARGQEKSRPVKDILQEIKKLAKNGCREVVLLGQTINNYQAPDPQNFSKKNPYIQKYSPLCHSRESGNPGDNQNKSGSPIKSGMTSPPESHFAALLWEINQIQGIELIDFTAPHPLYMTDEVIDALTLPKQANYLHLPVQCGDNKVLAQMNRKYTREYYLKIIKKIRAKKPDIALGTDIIVGFPGETKAQFEKTIDLYKKASFDIAYLAMYSQRSGTLAAKKLKDNISKKEKKRRWQFLQDLMEKITLKKNQKYLGKIIDVFVERRLNTNTSNLKSKILNLKSQYLGHSRETKRVRFEIPFIPPFKKGGTGGFVGKIVKVKIDQALTWELRGKFVGFNH